MFCTGMLAHLLDNDERCVESVRDFTNRYEMPYDTFVDAGEFVVLLRIVLEIFGKITI